MRSAISGNSDMTDHYPSRRGSDAATLPRLDPVVYSDWAESAPLSREQTEQYERDGFVVLHYLFSAQEIAALRNSATRLIADPGALDSKTVISEPGVNEVRSIFMIHRQHDVMNRLASDERLAGIARFILGDEIYVHQSRLNYKPGFVGKEFYWHSD